MAETWSIAEAARRCGCPRSTLQRAVRAGRLHLTADHRLTADALIQAGYCDATAAQQPHAAAAQQERLDLPMVLRDMQRSMERLTDMVAAIHTELRQMQQERSSRVPRAPAGTPQPRSRERQQRSPQERTHVPGYDPEAAAARIATLRTEGLSLAQIAERLNQEGVPTRRGLPWKKALVGWFLKHHGS
jgi:recombinase